MKCLFHYKNNSPSFADTKYEQQLSAASTEAGYGLCDQDESCYVDHFCCT